MRSPLRLPTSRYPRADRYSEIEAHLVEHHPWKNFEIIATPIAVDPNHPWPVRGR